MDLYGYLELHTVKSVRYLQNTIIKYVSSFFFLFPIPQNSEIFQISCNSSRKPNIKLTIIYYESTMVKAVCLNVW